MLTAGGGQTFANVTRYGPTEGWLADLDTEAQAYMTTRIAATAGHLYAYVPTNSGGSASTVTLRKGVGGGAMADTAVTLSIGASATGAFYDDVNTVSYGAVDQIAYKIVGPTTGTLTLTIIGVEYPQGAASAQPYYVRTGGVPGMRIGRPGSIFGRTW